MAGRYPTRRQYRGRSGKGSVVLKAIIALLALMILACILFFTVLGGRVEYTDDGVRIVAPWMQNAPGEAPGPESSAPIIVVEPE